MVYDWDFPAADEEFRRSIDLNPGYAKAHSLYACYFAAQRRFDEALVEVRHALDLDPVSIYDNQNLGWHLLMARRYPEASEQLRKTLDMDPANWAAHHWLSVVLQQQHRFRDAVAEDERAVALLENTTTLAGLASAYAGAGETGQARQVLERMRVLRSEVCAGL